MKATIEQINRFRITIEGKTWDNFKKCEDWEGMLKFSGPSGVLIVNSEESDFSSGFAVLFGMPQPKKPLELTVIKATPSLLPDGNRTLK